MKKVITSIFLISFLLAPAASLALDLNLQYPTFPPGPGGINLNDVARDPAHNLNKLIAWFYYFIVGIAGLAAFAMLVWGGVQWLTSAGNPSKIGDAKDKINSALLGLLIILGSWLILQVINPDLITLKLEPLP